LAGYFFNELVPGYIDRFNSFIDLFKTPVFGHRIDMNPFKNIEDVNVSFDFHLKQESETEDDRGEVADILIYDKTTLLAIEAKYLSNWSYEKDVVRNQKRINEFSEITSFKKPNIYHCLLVAENKWLNSIDQWEKLHKESSNYKKLKEAINNLEYPLSVITWQNILTKTTDRNVFSYLESRLKN
jgi:hypothetical protein